MTRHAVATIASLLLSGCTIGPALYIERTGDGSGEITSDPEGLHCGTDCAMIVDAESITLVASARPGSRFAGWDGLGCEGTDPCTVTLATDTTIGAVFDPVFHSLAVTKSGTGTGTLTSDPAGIDCGDACTAGFREGSTVSLTPTASPNSAFVGWSGGCTGTGACTVSLDLAATVNAEFVALQPLTVVHAGDGGGVVTSTLGGINCGSACEAHLPPGSVVRLTATAAAGSKFVGWSGACSGTGECGLAINEPTRVTARFDIYPCTSLVTASEPASVFNTRLTSAGKVICLADGVTITGPVVIGAPAITIQSLPGATGRIDNQTGKAVSLAGHSARLIGLDITSRGPSLTAAIDATDTALYLKGSTVRCESHNCYVVFFAHGGSAVIEDSTLLGGSQTDNYPYSYGVSGYYGTTIQITNSTVSSSATALSVSPLSHFTVTNSTLRGLSTSVAGTGNATIVVFHDASLVLTGSTIITTGYDAIYAGGNTVGVTLRLDGNTFRKAAGLPAGASSPIHSARADNVIHSTTPNTFCNEGTATDDGEFALPLISGSYAAASTFNSVSQAGPGDCP